MLKKSADAHINRISATESGSEHRSFIDKAKGLSKEDAAKIAIDITSLAILAPVLIAKEEIDRAIRVAAATPEYAQLIETIRTTTPRDLGWMAVGIVAMPVMMAGEELSRLMHQDQVKET